MTHCRRGQDGGQLGQPIAFKRLRHQAEAEGFGERMLQRVGKDLGVAMEREPMAGGGNLFWEVLLLLLHSCWEYPPVF